MNGEICNCCGKGILNRERIMFRDLSFRQPSIRSWLLIEAITVGHDAVYHFCSQECLIEYFDKNTPDNIPITSG